MNTPQTCQPGCCMHENPAIPSVDSIDTSWQSYGQLLADFDAAPSRLRTQIAVKQSETESDLQKLVEFAFQVKHFLGQLSGIKNKLIRNAAGYRWILSPLRTFPAEVLGEIFKLAGRDDGGRPLRLELGSSRVDMYPLRLSHVCSQWRDIVMSLPELWSHIDWKVTYRQMSTDRQQRRVELLRLALDKSGNRPLTLDWDIRDTTDFLFDSLSECFPHSSRWQVVKINLPTLQNLHRLLTTTSSVSLPNLQSLTIAVGPSYGGLDEGEDEDQRPFPDFFRSAPSLRTVALMGTLRRMRLPWSQIEELTLKPTSGVLALHPLLSRCSQLRSLTIESRHLLAGATGADSIQLPHLHTLSISYDEELTLDAHVIRYLVLPKLEHLSIVRRAYTPSEDDDDQPTIVGTREMIHRSGCSPSSLHLENMNMQPDQWTSLLSTIPSLTKLSLSDDGTFSEEEETDAIPLNQLFQRLMATANPVLLPRLQELSLSVWFHAEETYPFEAFIAAILSRGANYAQQTENLARPVDVLKKVSFLLLPETLADLANRVEEIKAAGITVETDTIAEA